VREGFVLRKVCTTFLMDDFGKFQEPFTEITR
jgi:hypothetical protein